MASTSSVSLPGLGQHSFWFYWTLCNSTLSRLGEYCKLASEKIKAIIYKQDQDEDKKIEDKFSALVETVKSLSEKPNKCSSTEDTCKTYLCDDTMPENDENIWSKNAATPHLFPNADKMADQKNGEDVLSIVESMVTAKLEAEFYIKEQESEDQLSNSEDKPEDINQDTVCSNHSDLQKTDGGTVELKLIKHSDGNNNDSKSTPCMSKVNDKQKSTCKVTSIESSKSSIETKNKDMHIKTSTKTVIKADSNTNLTKDNEKFSSPNNSKKTVSNSSKSLSTTDRNGRDYFNNKQNNARTPCMKKQEFAKRNVSRNGIEKEIKNTIWKPNLAKTGIETADTPCQNKNSNKDKASQKQQQTTSKQFTPKSKGQESFRRNVSMLNFSDDKNKTEKAPHTFENVESPLHDSERKDEKIINEKTVQSDQKANRGVDLKSTFVAQYKNSTFSKPMQNNSRIGQNPMYGRNPSYANPKFDRDRNGGARVPKKEHVSNAFTKSNIGIEEFNTSNLEKQKKEIIQPTNVKSTDKIDARVFNDKKDIDPVTVETHLTQSKESMNSSVDHPEQVETNKISLIEIDQQCKETNNEEMNAFKHSNLSSDKYATNSQINVVHQYSLKENMQRTNDVNQLENLTIWNQSDNAAQNGATMMDLQQSFQNMHFNPQLTSTQVRNPTRHMSWEPNNSKFYDQHFPASDAMRLSQIPNTFNAPPPYECNAQMPSDNGIAAISTMDAISCNRDNSNVLYRYGSNVQQRPVMASEFPAHSVSPCQTNQARWSSPVQDGFHIEHPYVPTQPAMMHVYNPAVFNPDDFNNTHTMDYLPHPVIYAQAPYMQTWNSQLQYPVPVLYNTPCTNYTTFSHSNQPNNFNNSVHDQHHKHDSYAQMNNYVRDTYNDTNTCAVQTRNTIDNVPIKPNYYYKKYQDNCRPVYDAPPYVPSVSYSRSQQGINYMPATGINQYNASYCPSNQKQYKQNVPGYMKNPKNQIQDFSCDDNGSEDAPPIISPTEFVTNNINLSNKTDQFATRVFKPEFKTKSNSGYRPPSVPRYGGGFRRNTFQDFPKEYSYPVSIGRGTYNKAKKT